MIHLPCPLDKETHVPSGGKVASDRRCVQIGFAALSRRTSRKGAKSAKKDKKKNTRI
jgi:hypothetical protein